MAELFVISPEFEKKLHPEARRIFHDWTGEIQRQVQLDEVTDDDLNFLPDNDKIKLKTGVLKIPECLNKCIGIKEGDKLYDVYFGDIFWQRGVISELRRELMFIRWDIEPPLRKIYLARLAKAKDDLRKRTEEEKRKLEEAKETERKREEEERRQAAKAEAERREKEDSERWRAAYIAIQPPMDDAKKYLNGEEYEKFEKATWKAVDIYKEKKEEYLDDRKTSDYRNWLWKINYRKEEERRKIAATLEAQKRKAAAESEAREYSERLNAEIERLKSILCSSKKNLATYFQKEIKDPRYTGQLFSQFLSSEEKEDFGKTIVDIGTRELDKIVSKDLRKFLDVEYWRSYFLLPSAEYRSAGVPYLDFIFEVFAVVEIRFSLKPGQETFDGYPFNLSWRDEQGCPILLEQPEFLGYHYFILSPKDLGGYVPFRSVPLVLLRGLLNGEIKPAGVTVSAARDSWTSYKIPKFEEEVNIPDIFANYLKNIGSIDQMLSMGIIAEKVAGIVKSESGELKLERKASPLKDRIERKDTGKAKAFRLFDEGKRPSHRELKALKIKSKSIYSYYEEWKGITRQ